MSHRLPARRCLCAIILLALGPARPAVGQQPDPTDLSPTETAQHDEWYDRLRPKAYRLIDDSIRWFDGLFGDEVVDLGTNTTDARIMLGVRWDSQHGWGLVPRAQIRLRLPQLSYWLADTLNRLTGRPPPEPTQQVITRPIESLHQLNPRFRSIADADWLYGLRYAPPRSAPNGWDLDPNIYFGIPLNYWVKLHWRYSSFPSQRDLFRFKQTLFATRLDGFGTQTKISVDQVWSPETITRAEAKAKIGTATEGLEWFVDAGLFHQLSAAQSLAFEVQAQGETEEPVTVGPYGLGLTHRQRVSRDWLALETTGSVYWEKHDPGQRREPEFRITVGIDAHFPPGG